MTPGFIPVLLASLTAGLITTLGILTISRYEEWGERYSVYFMSFAAGVLICVSFMHLIPHSLNMNKRAPVLLLMGFLLLYVSNRFLDRYIHGAELAVGIIPMLGIGFHSLVDGVIYSVTFNVSVFTGTLAALGMIFHEFPEGIITFVLLKKGGFSRKKAIIYSLLAAAVSTPLGAFVSYPFIRNIGPELLGSLLALSAGALVYVGATHLLPAAEEERRRYSILAMAAGILVALVIIFSKH